MLQESTGREKDGAILLRNMALYSIVHALVDFTCAAVILSKATAVLLSEDSYVFMIILYNIIAFALQAPLGYLVDKLRKPVQAALLSYFFLAAGVL
ncbi:MAG: hypothetical protein Q8930_18085, partial [Bacillota bacterium]|nr:hypothetical protein [Bacillota bacterium]